MNLWFLIYLYLFYLKHPDRIFKVVRVFSVKIGERILAQLARTYLGACFDALYRARTANRLRSWEVGLICTRFVGRCAVILSMFCWLTGWCWAQPERVYRGQTIWDLAEIEESQIDLGLWALVIAKHIDPEVDVPAYLQRLDQLAQAVETDCPIAKKTWPN